MTPPPRPQNAADLLRWADQVSTYLRRLQPREAPGTLLNQGPDGWTLTPRHRPARIAPPPAASKEEEKYLHPYLYTDKNGSQCWTVTPGIINNTNPINGDTGVEINSTPNAQDWGAPISGEGYIVAVAEVKEDFTAFKTPYRVEFWTQEKMFENSPNNYRSYADLGWIGITPGTAGGAATYYCRPLNKTNLLVFNSGNFFVWNH